MSKRSEQEAIKAYPWVIEEHTERDLNKQRRLSYIKGYEQAEKDTIERACELLLNYIFEDVTPEMISHFRKRIEEDNE